MPRKPKPIREIEVVITYTEGWEERFAKAAYNLYLRMEAKGGIESSVSESARKEVPT